MEKTHGTNNRHHKNKDGDVAKRNISENKNHDNQKTQKIEDKRLRNRVRSPCAQKKQEYWRLKDRDCSPSEYTRFDLRDDFSHCNQCSALINSYSIYCLPCADIVGESDLHRDDDIILTFLDDRRRLIENYREERSRFHTRCTENDNCGECEGISHCQECAILIAEGNVHCLQCSYIIGDGEDDLYLTFLNDKLQLFHTHWEERHTCCTDDNTCGECEEIDHCYHCGLLIGKDTG
jgi:hypothetical protein